MMDKEAMFAAITDQRQALIVTLDELADDEWDTPTLCDGWRVRDVVGHLVSVLEIPIGRFLLNVAKARNFNIYADRVAREFGAREPDRLLAEYRRLAASRFAPPIVGPIAPLTDVFVHSRDIGRPLARPARFDPDALVEVLGYLCGGKARGFIPPKRTRGLAFEATDLGWKSGEGSLVSGSAEAIMLAVAARRSALTDLEGDGVAVLESRLP